MPNAPTFVEFAVDLLSLAGPVQARGMFGGHGLYCRGVMFGLLYDDELFLKTDLETRARFVDAGCRMWSFPGMDETSYYRPPDDAHEDPEAMLPWARLALDAALRGQAAKVAKARAAEARRAERAAAAADKKKKPAKAPPKPARAVKGKVVKPATRKRAAARPRRRPR
jgi:DNA transformation protein and related proteins